MNKKTNIYKSLPVLFGFFVMGFVDIVGISTNYVKKDFDLSDSLSNLLPMMVFLWFFVFSVPIGMLMNKIGRKSTVILSGFVTFLAMLLPFFIYNFPFVLVSFALLGIGNTILQVSLNPLLSNVVREDRLTSRLTLGQFIKAISSFLGPFLASWATLYFDNWKYVFPFLAIVTLLSAIWLLFTPVKEDAIAGKKATFSQCIGLLNDRKILLFFFGIFFAVGIDVGLNTTIPKFLQERCGLSLEDAGYGISLYFIARTLGTFIGTFLLTRISGKKVFVFSMVLAVLSIIVLFFTNDLFIIRSVIFIQGLAIANVFPVIFSAALKEKPGQFNEVSGLMIMGVSGGAFITLIIGIASDLVKSQQGGIIIITLSILYLLFCAFKMKSEKLT